MNKIVIIVYGILSIIATLIGIAGISVLLLSQNAAKGQCVKMSGVRVNTKMFDFSEIEHYHLATILPIMLFFVIAGEICYGLLLFGVWKRLPKYVVPWIFVRSLTLVIRLFCIAIIFTVRPGEGFWHLMNLLLSAFSLYYVVMYYREINQSTSLLKAEGV